MFLFLKHYTLAFVCFGFVIYLYDPILFNITVTLKSIGLQNHLVTAKLRIRLDIFIIKTPLK